jgi:heptosyltransferase II
LSPDLSAAVPARLVIRAPNWLGDAVMALPALGAVRAAWPETRIAIAAIPSVAPLFEEQTGADQDEIIPITTSSEIGLLGGSRFDAALLLPNSFRAAWTARQAGIVERWGYRGNFRTWLLSRPVPKPAGHVHQTAYYADLVRGLGFDIAESLPRVSVRPQTDTRAKALLEQHGVDGGTSIVGFAPGAAGGHAKRWPPARVADVIARLSGTRRATCVLVGAAGDRDAAREIESSLSPDVRLVNLIGRTDLRLLAGVLARCDAFVSNDSGAMHLAAALGVPVVAIFGPTDDRVTAPPGGHDVLIHDVFCRPCMLRDCPIDHRCMKGITADAVFAAVSARLESGRGRSGA